MHTDTDHHAVQAIDLIRRKAKARAQTKAIKAGGTQMTQPRYHLTLEPIGVSSNDLDGTRRLRSVLKALRGGYGFRCTRTAPAPSRSAEVGKITANAKGDEP